MEQAFNSERVSNGREYKLRAVHIAEKIKLKDFKDRFGVSPIEFSNYEVIFRLQEDAYLLIYHYGSVVFFNLSEEEQSRILSVLQEGRIPVDPTRASDHLVLEVMEMYEQLPLPLLPQGAQGGHHKVLFDRVTVTRFSYEVVKIVCMLLAESSALDYHENLIENVLVRTNAFSKALKLHGRILENDRDLIQFIGLCLDTKQEIISNLYIFDAPDETWDHVELDKLHQDLKLMMEIAARYKALEHKIKMIQESVSVIVDLSSSRQSSFREKLIIALIFLETVLAAFLAFSHKGF